MTAFDLLGLICAVLLVQIVAAVIYVVLRPKPAPSNTIPVREIPNAAWQGLRAFRVSMREDEDDALTQTSFYLEPTDGQPLPLYRAGQFLTFPLDLPDREGAIHEVIRCYSLSDRPDQRAYRITVKRIPPPLDRPDLPPGLVSTHFHNHVMPGTILQVRAPAGAFVLADDARIPTVLIAGGIGITPLFAMARTALAAQPDRAFHLFYGVRDSSELVFEADLIALAEHHPNFRLTIVQSAPLPTEVEPDCSHETGFIDVALLRRVLPHGEHHFYICGPPPMMANLVPALRGWGVARGAVHYEAFGPASIESADALAADALDSPLAIQFAQSKRTIDWTGAETNLLDFAERGGIAITSGCRSGSCGTCETAILSGAVRYAQPPSFDVAGGHCLLCVAVPTSDLVLEA